jgi:hypothetical protein
MRDLDALLLNAGELKELHEALEKDVAFPSFEDPFAEIKFENEE